MQHGDDRDADVDLGVVEPDFDAAVLGQALFGDVEMTEDFDAGNDGWLEPLELRRHGHLLQFTVNPVADSELVLEGFQMHIGGAQFDGVFEDLVDEPDDGCLVFGGVIQIGVLGVLVHHLEALFLVEGADGVGAYAEAFFDFALDGFRGCEHRLQVQTGECFESVQSVGGEEPAGGHLHGAVVATQGK